MKLWYCNYKNVCNTRISFEKNSQKRVDYFVALCENIEDDVLVIKEHPIRYYIHLKGVSK